MKKLRFDEKLVHADNYCEACPMDLLMFENKLHIDYE